MSEQANLVSREMLNAAMKEAVKVGLMPEYCDSNSYIANWKHMEMVLRAAINAR